jgi:photosystem II stability/assembly factor-like uncharacterized protein
MNIKNITLLAASGLIAVASVFLLNDSTKEQYFSRESNSFEMQKQIHSGYLDYMKSIRDNRETGGVSTGEVASAFKQASKMRKGNKALGLNWNFKGPDNVGGRTRAIVIDFADTNHIFAGAVSGGLWESTDAGRSWSAYDDGFKIQNVSAMAQAANGDIIVATGAYHDGSGNNKAVGSEFVGNGVWRLTGNRNSDLIVGPNSEFNYGEEWATTAEIATDPNNSQRFFIAMNRGLRETNDGGATWTNPLGITTACQDVHITADGKIAAGFAGSVRISTDNGITWNTSNFPTGSRARVEIAIAPSNSNVMYAANSHVSNGSCTEGVYKTNDAGLTWSKILNTPNYMGNPVGCQGFYDNTIAVFPDNEGKIVTGGVNMFQWTQSSVDPAPLQGEWKIIATNNKFFGSGSRNPYYIHSDVHKFVFHPTNPNKLFVGSDGGVGFSANMNDLFPTYGQYNAGYNVTQFYDIGVGPKDLVIGGTQDNGTQLLGLGFNTGTSAVEVRGGDGFDVDLFTINPELGIASLYYGDIERVQGIGSSLGSSTFNNAAIYSGTVSALCGNGFIKRCSEVFYTTTAKWESFNHTATKDSVIVRDSKETLPPLAANTVINYASKNNSIPLTDSLVNISYPKDTTTINPNSANDTLSIGIDSSIKVRTFQVAFDTITVDENSMMVEIRYRGKYEDSVRTVVATNSQGDTVGRPGDVVVLYNGIDTLPFTYEVPVNYNNIFHNDLSRALPPRAPLSITVVRDLVRGQSEIVYIEPQVRFNYQFEFPDIVQSTVATFNIKGNLPSQTNQRHIWISKDVQKGGSVTEPRWIKVAGNNSLPNSTPNSANAISAVFSNDGDKLFYGTSSGDLYRIDNLNEIDLSQLGVSLPNDYTVDNTTTHRKIADFGNRAVTGIAVDPNNDDNVIVTLGNYGSAQYVQRSINATALSGVQFVQISGAGLNKLPSSPAYEAIIDFRDNNKVIVGTELGVFATDNAFTTATASDDGQTVIDVQWTEENTGLGRAPVMAVKQMTFGWEEGAVNQGKIYIGTHGRGIYEADQLVGISNNNTVATENKIGKNNLVIYPNPAANQVNIEFNSANNSLVSVQLFNLNGQIVREIRPTNLQKGENTFNLNVEQLNRGTYIIRTIVDGVSTTGKFIKQ